MEQVSPAGLYRHMDGGFYEVIGTGRHCDTLEDYVWYRHLWPHDEGHWMRRLAEWQAPRFVPTDAHSLAEAKKQDRAAAQQQVAEAKRLRRSQKTT